MDSETLSLILDTIYQNAYNDGYNDCKLKAKDYINELKESYKNGNELQNVINNHCGQSTKLSTSIVDKSVSCPHQNS